METNTLNIGKVNYTVTVVHANNSCLETKIMKLLITFLSEQFVIQPYNAVK